jgi:hypothetical protein
MRRRWWATPTILFDAKALHSRAEVYSRRCLAIAEARFDPNDPRIAVRLNNLAELLRATNRLGEAEPLYRGALAIDEASLGKDHPIVASFPVLCCKRKKPAHRHNLPFLHRTGISHRESCVSPAP